MPVPRDPALRSLALLAAALLAFAGCSGGQERPILADTITAHIVQDPPPVSGAAVYFGNVKTTGDTIMMDILVRGPLDVDDADLVLRYDATFIQVVTLTSQGALFGTCNTVNAACSLVSPVCADDRPAANGGQGSPPDQTDCCRLKGIKTCTVATEKTACPDPGDACGTFGRLSAAYAVVTGPKVCSNRASQTCAQSSDCQFCNSSPAITCAGSVDCSGTCTIPAGSTSGTCDKPAGRVCTADIDCADTCGAAGTCRGCPSVTVADGQVVKLATITLRVMTSGSSEFRFVVSSTAGASGVSALRKDLTDQTVQFFPSVDTADPSVKIGSILIQGTK